MYPDGNHGACFDQAFRTSQHQVSDNNQRRNGHGADGRGTDSFFGLRDGEQLIFVGSLNCLRHKPYMTIAGRMAAGAASVLCPTMAEFSTGRYLHLLRDAVLEIADERNADSFVVAYGCQWVILSTDADLLAEELQREHGIALRFFDDCHIDENAHH